MLPPLAIATFKSHLLQAATLCLLTLSALIPHSIFAASISMPGLHEHGATFYAQQAKVNNIQTDVRPLRPNEAVKREMAGGEVHIFQVALTRGQYLRVVVEQQGIDAGVRILTPDNRSLIEMDSPSRLKGPESVSVVAEVAGDYKVEVNSDKSSPSGSYEIKIESLREPTEADSNRVVAERALVEGHRLRSHGTTESRKLAVEKYKEALALWKALGDVRWEAYTLCNMGRTFRASGNLKESLDYFNQALTLLQGASDNAGQAFVLNEMAAAYRDLGQPSKALEVYDQALAIRRKEGDRWGEAQLLNNIGIIYAGTG